MINPKASSPLPTDVVQLAVVLEQTETAYGACSPEMAAVRRALEVQEGEEVARLLLARAGDLSDIGMFAEECVGTPDGASWEPEVAPADQPYWASHYGFPSADEPEGVETGVVTVDLVARGVSDVVAELDDDDRYADSGGKVQLVRVATTKDTTLTRQSAIWLAGALLDAASHSFHRGRAGKLRPAQARDLVDTIREAETKLAELREHVLDDLLAGVGLFATPFAFPDGEEDA